jgi:hypothetical protein
VLARPPTNKEITTTAESGVLFFFLSHEGLVGIVANPGVGELVVSSIIYFAFFFP